MGLAISVKSPRDKAMSEILVLYYSRHGSTLALARQISRGIESVAGMQARLRTVPPVASVIDKAAPAVPEEGAPYARDRKSVV